MELKPEIKIARVVVYFATEDGTAAGTAEVRQENAYALEVNAPLIYPRHLRFMQHIIDFCLKGRM